MVTDGMGPIESFTNTPSSSCVRSECCRNVPSESLRKYAGGSGECGLEDGIMEEDEEKGGDKENPAFLAPKGRGG